MKCYILTTGANTNHVPRVAAFKEFPDMTPDAIDEIFDFIRKNNHNDKLDGFAHIFDNEGRYCSNSEYLYKKGHPFEYYDVPEEVFTDVYPKQLKMFKWN